MFIAGLGFSISITLSAKLVVAVVVVDGRACWRHLYHNRGVAAVYYKSVNSNPSSPFELLWICCTTCSTAGKILTDIARRAVRLLQQSFLFTLMYALICVCSCLLAK